MIYKQLADYLDNNFGVLPLQGDLQEMVAIFAPLAMEFAVWIDTNTISVGMDRWRMIPSKAEDVKTIAELWQLFRQESTLLETFMGVENDNRWEN